MSTPPPSSSPEPLPEEILLEIVSIYMERHRKDHSIPIIPLLTSNKAISAAAIPLLYSEVIISSPGSYTQLGKKCSLKSLKKIQYLILDVSFDRGAEYIASEKVSDAFKDWTPGRDIPGRLSLTGYRMDAFWSNKIIQHILSSNQTSLHHRVMCVDLALILVSRLSRINKSMQEVSIVTKLTCVSGSDYWTPEYSLKSFHLHLIPPQSQHADEALLMLGQVLKSGTVGQMVLNIGFLKQAQADLVIAWAEGQDSDKVEVICDRDLKLVECYVDPATGISDIDFDSYPHAVLPKSVSSADDGEDEEVA